MNDSFSSRTNITLILSDLLVGGYEHPVLQKRVNVKHIVPTLRFYQARFRYLVSVDALQLPANSQAFIGVSSCVGDICRSACMYVLFKADEFV